MRIRIGNQTSEDVELVEFLPTVGGAVASLASVGGQGVQVRLPGGVSGAVATPWAPAAVTNVSGILPYGYVS